MPRTAASPFWRGAGTASACISLGRRRPPEPPLASEPPFPSPLAARLAARLPSRLAHSPPAQDTDALEQPGGLTAEEHTGSVVLTNDLLCASIYLDPSDDPTLDFVLRQGSQSVNYLFVHIGAKAVEGGWACFGFITPAEDDIMALLRRLGQRPPAA